MTQISEKNRLVIWGASGHARVVADIVRLQGIYQIAGFIDDLNPDRYGTEFCKSTILGGQEQLDKLLDQGIRHILFGFGNCEARLRLSELVLEKGFELVTAIHPSAILASDVVVGPGTVIAAGVVINPCSIIGRNVIINTCASVDHECVIEDGAHVCPGVHLAGRVTVKRAAWVGIGATVIERVTIGAASQIGAGAAVVDDIPDGVIAYGVPARVIHSKGRKKSC
jgi:UDP-N-acetylbacillosamine N-acetyltransferase